MARPVEHEGFMSNIQADFEFALITFALDCTDWNRTQAAQLLGCNRTTLIGKMKEYDITELYKDQGCGQDPRSSGRWADFDLSLINWRRQAADAWARTVNERLQKRVKELVA